MRKDDAKVNKKVALPEPLTEINRDLYPRLFLNVCVHPVHVSYWC